MTLTPSDTVDYTNATATVSINVNQATPTITWSNPAAITYGTALSNTQLNASGSVAGSLAYSSAAGTILSAGSGETLSVTLTPTDTVDYTNATATVSINVNQATPTITWSTPADITYGTALSATQRDATGSIAGTLAYSSAAGTILMRGSGETLSVTLTPSDTVDYTNATATVSINVNQATPIITWSTPADITYGTALNSTQLDATGSVAGTLGYSAASGTVLSAGTGETLSVTLTPSDTVDYANATTTVSINVNQATPIITWSTPADITYGTALSSMQLDATCSVAGTLAYSPAAATVLNAGAGETLSVTLTPSDTVDYTNATATVSINVNQATPIITWSTPADITYGTALSATQLDAIATVAGTFTYSPATGTVLGSGQYDLSLTFTPTDTRDFTNATATVPLTVDKASTATVVASTPALPVLGQTVTFTATLSAVSPGAGVPSGQVTFTDGTTTLAVGTLSGGMATFSTAALSVGTHTITVAYNGDNSFEGSNGSKIQSIAQASTSITLVSSLNPSDTSQLVTLTATVSVLSPGAERRPAWSRSRTAQPSLARAR